MIKQNYELKKPLNHLAIIMDGNGRYAQKLNKPRTYGHKVAINNLFSLLEEIKKYGIKCVSLFAFSTENWNRPKTEIKLLFSYLNTYLKKNINKMVEEDTRLYVSGDYSKLPSSSVKLIDTAINKTKNCKTFKLNICLNYGGIDELVRATNKIIKSKIKIVTKETIEKYLDVYTELGPIDLLIRTSGEQRISNFMLYYLAYSEIIFYKKNFPEFDAKCLRECLKEYESRDRRFGGIKNGK